MALRDSDPAEVGGYRIEDRLGSGGMGVVYLARSASGRRLALKVVHGQYADDDEFRTRFSREVAAARQVSGAFTAPMVDADADAPRPWMATLYIPGEDLGTHVRRHGPLSPDRLRELAAGLAEALRDIHRAGVVHRDLKPANVMLAEDGPRVIDFGISRAAESTAADALTQTGRVMGTPPFMSPEQFTSPNEVGPATDVFSVGAVLVYAATRRGPFDSESPWETATRVVEGTPDLDGVPDELLPYVRLCLEKHPKSRPTPDELLHLLREGRLPVPAREPAEPDTEPVRPRRGRRRWLVAGAALTALAAVAATAVAVDRGDGDGARRALPAGWHAWHRQSKDPTAGQPHGQPPADSFNGCGATGTSLVCAGDGVMATRFALADGRNTWALAMDPTPTQYASGGGGTIIGIRHGTVYTFGADDREDRKNPDGGVITRYTVQAVEAATGKVLWKTVTGDTDAAKAAGTDSGGAALTPLGVVTTFGNRSESYALLDPAHGEIRWKQRLPYAGDGGPVPKGTCQLYGTAGQAYLVCKTADKDGNVLRTTVAQIDPATGRPRWTVTTKDDVSPLGRAGEHLVLAGDPTQETLHSLTLINLSSHILTRVGLSRSESATAAYLVNGIVYFTLSSGSIRAVEPSTGRLRWESYSTVEVPGPPAASATRLYVASPTGRLAALDLRTGKLLGTVPGRNDAGTASGAGTSAAPPVLAGDAVYVCYGIRAVYSVDTRDL